MLALKAQLSYPHFRNRPLQIGNLNLGWEMEFGGIQMASNRKSLIFTIAGAVALALGNTRSTAHKTQTLHANTQ